MCERETSTHHVSERIEAGPLLGRASEGEAAAYQLRPVVWSRTGCVGASERRARMTSASEQQLQRCVAERVKGGQRRTACAPWCGRGRGEWV